MMRSDLVIDPFPYPQHLVHHWQLPIIRLNLIELFRVGVLGGIIGSTLVFVLAATLAGVFPWEIFSSQVLTNYFFKGGIEAAFTPATYRVVNGLKRAENEDFYYRGTKFTPV